MTPIQTMTLEQLIALKSILNQLCVKWADSGDYTMFREFELVEEFIDSKIAEIIK